MTNLPENKPTGPEQGDKGAKKPRGMGGIFIIFLLLLALFIVVSKQGDPSRRSIYQFWIALFDCKFKQVIRTPDEQLTGILEKGEKIEVVVKDLTEEELQTIQDIQAAVLDKVSYKDGLARFLADFKNEQIFIDKVWFLHLTKPRDTGRGSKSVSEQAESDYLTAFITTKAGVQKYVKVPIFEPDKSLQPLRVALANRGVEVRNKALSIVPTFEVHKVDTLTYYLLGTIAPWILIIGLFWFFIIRQMRSPGGSGGVLSFGRSRAAKYTKEQRTHVTFVDVEGMDEAKEEVREIIEFLKNRGKFQRLGGRIPRGVLLVGAPGTGKTLLAKAIAGEANVPFFSISGSDFVEMFVGVGASRVRDLFKQARENSPCIVFLDEIDAVGRKRGSGVGGGHDEREQTLNAILVEMDGFDTDEGIILVGATNRPDVLDPALLRPGRFDRQVVIDMPDVAGREAILKVHAKKIKTESDPDFDRLARATPGFSGAELAALINEAAILAGMQGAATVTMVHFEEARDRVRWGREKPSRRMQEEDRQVTAYHEAGHAIVGARIPEVDPVHKITIISRGRALGATMYLPERDDYHMRRSKMLGMIAMSYGGRVAEGLVFDDISAGAQNDIQHATRIARMMVAEWGMSNKVGPLNYAVSPENTFLGHEFHFGKEHSEETARLIDQEVREIIDGCYKRAEEILMNDRALLDRVADALLKHETLTGEELQAILAGEPIDHLHEPRPKAETEANPAEPSGTPEPGADEDLGLSGAEGLATS
ncbi:MAG: ATP-dependent zinc metalloprotease FtsH [Planctomycetota bacterium]